MKKVLSLNGMYFLISSQSLLLAAQNGSILWSNTLGSAFIQTSPALARDNTIYIVAGDNNLYAITNSGISASNKWVTAGGGPPAIASDG